MVASLTPDALAAAVVSLQHKRANDPWDGPHGSARPNQLSPAGDWRTWLILSGRGFGKTRTAAEWVRKEVQDGRMGRIALVGSTAADVRDVMVQGESGLLACCHRAGFGAVYNPSLRKVTFANGAVAFTYSADEPDRLRGPQHDGAWGDEIAAWRYAEAFDQLQFGLRLGSNPRQVLTTTPRPIALVRDLLAQEATGVVHVTRGTTYDNRDNLAPAFFEQIISKYEGTSLGRQELLGELVDEVEGAMWQRATIDRHRVDAAPRLGFERVSVAIDPATTYGDDSDQTGLAVAGRGHDHQGYVLYGAGVRVPPHEWADRAVALYDLYEADEIVAEANQGGEMVRETLLNACIGRPVRPRIRLIHASRGKDVRAEPVALMYEQGRVHHVGTFPNLEDQMCAFPIIKESPDMVDALVHAVVAVMDFGRAASDHSAFAPVEESGRDRIRRYRRGTR